MMNELAERTDWATVARLQAERIERLELRLTACLHLLREIRTSHFLACSIVPKIDAILKAGEE